MYLINHFLSIKSYFLIAIFVLSQSLFSQPDSVVVLSLEQCKEKVLQQNVILQDAKANLELSEAKYELTQNAGILPKFELRNAWGPSPQSRGFYTDAGYLVSPDTADFVKKLKYFSQTDLNFEQPIYTFGKYSSVSEAAYQDVLAKQADIQIRQNEILFQIEQLYWGLVLGKELQVVIKEAQEEVAKAENKLKEKLDEGSEDVSQTDLFKLELFKYEINKRASEAETKLDLAQSTLKIALGLSDDRKIAVRENYLEPVDFNLEDIGFYFDLAIKNAPGLQKSRMEANQKEALLFAARSQYFPQFFFGGEIKHNYAADRFDPNNPFANNSTNYLRANVGVGAKQDLNFVQTRDKIRISAAEYELANQKQIEHENQVRDDILRVYLKLKSVQTKLESSQKALKASDNWLRSASMSYDFGVGEVKNLIDAFKANGAMQVEHFQNIFEFNTTVAELGKAVGVQLIPY